MDQSGGRRDGKKGTDSGYIYFESRTDRTSDVVDIKDEGKSQVKS